MTFDDNTFELINDKTGFAIGDKFNSEDEVRAYFTPEAQILMFDHEAVTDEAELSQMADLVIENHWHMAPKRRSSYDLINLVRDAVGAIPLKLGSRTVAIKDADTDIYTAYGVSVLHWANSQGEKHQEPASSITALYTAIDKAHGRVLGAVMAGAGFQGPWVSDRLNRHYAILDVTVDENPTESRWPVTLICKRMPDLEEEA